MHSTPPAGSADSPDPPAAPVAGGRRAHPGLFVVLEGGDGAGKSTQLRLLAERMGAAGVDHVRTREPGGTALGRVLREAILHGGEVTARAEALLYAADRAQHVAALVRPALERGAVVLSDRYLDSSVAYQGGARGLGTDAVRELSLWATEGLVPDLIVLLDLDPATGAARRAGTRRPDRIEAEPGTFHAQVRERFLALARAAPQRYLVLDAAAPAEEIHARIWDAVAPRIAAQEHPRGRA